MCIARQIASVSKNIHVTTIGQFSIGIGFIAKAQLPLTKPDIRDSKS